MFVDERKVTLLGSLTLITQVLDSQDILEESRWLLLRQPLLGELKLQSDALKVSPHRKRGMRDCRAEAWAARHKAAELAYGHPSPDQVDIDGGNEGDTISPVNIASFTKGLSHNLESGLINPQDLESYLKYFEDNFGDLGASEDLLSAILPEIINIPGATFPMGRSEKDLNYISDQSSYLSQEIPLHSVKIKDFFLSKNAITQYQWKIITGLPKVSRDLPLLPSAFRGDSLPVEQVSWLDAVEFCDRLSHYTGRHYRLPTEAEWEYACRAGTATPFHYGEAIRTELANYQGTEAFANGPKGEYRQTTTVVDMFPANAFGLHDMHGNVWEWCLDHWHDNYEGAPVDGSAWLSETDDAPRVIRGGAWSASPENCRSASRRRVPADYRSSDIGFRVVCSIPPSEK